jgi:hypothetical protein
MGPYLAIQVGGEAPNHEGDAFDAIEWLLEEQDDEPLGDTYVDPILICPQYIHIHLAVFFFSKRETQLRPLHQLLHRVKIPHSSYSLI